MPVGQKKIDKYFDLVIRYREKYPYFSGFKLAHQIYKENKHIDTTQKTFEEIVYKNLDRLSKPNEVNLDLDIKDEIELIPSAYKDRPSFIIPSGVDLLGIMNDIHIPYHDSEALRTTIRYFKDRGVKGILINGDMIDCYPLSKFHRKPDQTNAFFEIEHGRMFLEQLRRIFPNIPIYYKFANHEERWEMFIENKVPEMAGDPDIYLDSRLKLNHYHIELIKDKRVIEFGRLNIIHGHEMFASSGAVNLARNYLLKSFDNIAFGHFHRTQDYMKPTIKHKNLGSFAIGCLCGLSPDYAPLNDWNHGFAIAKRDNEGYFEFENKMIINGKII